jgi:hypothetical protein
VVDVPITMGLAGSPASHPPDDAKKPTHAKMASIVRMKITLQPRFVRRPDWRGAWCAVAS